MLYIFSGIGGLILGAGVGYAFCFRYFTKINTSTFRDRDKVLADAKVESEKIVVDARDRAAKSKEDAEKHDVHVSDIKNAQDCL